MELLEQLTSLAKRVENTLHLVQTEEATKNAMIMPLIQMLGYNPFDPLEVTPELTADIGTKKGEKVDYAIIKDGSPIIIFECKKSGSALNIKHAGQLFRYFHVTAAKFAILTNGIEYQFFTDLDQPNKMDEVPFFSFDLLRFKDKDASQLAKFSKSNFNVDAILETANEMKTLRFLRKNISQLVDSPSEDFVKLIAQDLLGGRRFAQLVKDQYAYFVKKAFRLEIDERVNDRLMNAINYSGRGVEEVGVSSEPVVLKAIEVSVDVEPNKEDLIVTTREEIEAFYAVKAMLRGRVDLKRVFLRDAQSYCAILLDDNNRRPICRLRFNNLKKLRVGIFNADREEVVFDLSEIEDIFQFADQIAESVVPYLVRPDGTDQLVD